MRPSIAFILAALRALPSRKWLWSGRLAVEADALLNTPPFVSMEPTKPLSAFAAMAPYTPRTCMFVPGDCHEQLASPYLPNCVATSVMSFASMPQMSAAHSGVASLSAKFHQRTRP